MLIYYCFFLQPPKRPNALCGICLKGPESNKKGLQEDLIHCSQCENSGMSNFLPNTSYIGTVPSCASTYVHVRNGIVHVNLGHLGRVDIPVGQVSLHSRLPDGQEVR